MKQFNLSLSQLYQSEMKQFSQQKEPLKYKFDQSDRKQQEKFPIEVEPKIMQKSSIIEDYKFEIENPNKSVIRFNQNSSTDYKKQIQQNYQVTNINSSLQKQNNFDLDDLKFSKQFQKLHLTTQKSNDSISLYYYKPSIGITYNIKENLLITTIEQSHIAKIRNYLNESQVEEVLVYYSINFPVQLLASLKQLISNCVKEVNYVGIESYDIQEKLELVGFPTPEIYNENVIDKQIYINLCSALPIMNRKNLDSILDQLNEKEQFCKLKFNEQAQQQLGILKTIEKPLSIQQLYEKFFSTQQARKMFLENLKNPVSSYQIINKRIQYLQTFHSLSLQPSNQKFIKMPSKIGSFSQILKILSSYQEKSEPYLKLFTQLQSLVDFVSVVKQLVIIDRRAQQQTCQLLKDVSNINLEKIQVLIDLIETSLLFNQSNVQIKEQQYPQLEQLLQYQTNLKARINLIKNKHQTELALIGIKPQSLDIKFVNENYLLVIQINIDILSKIENFGWELINERNSENQFNFKTSYTIDLDEQFGNLDDQIISIQDKILISIVKQIQSYSELLLQVESLIGEIDYYIGLSQAITQLRLCIPKLNNQNYIKIQGSRHLLVEQTKKSNIEFQPNDFNLSDKRIFLIVGPNYSGKSVFIRQIGIIIYLIHCGLPVPALNADSILLEEIHTLFPCENRNTNLSITNQEFYSLSQALKVSSRSLVLMDEIGKTFKYQVGSNLHKSTLEYFMQMAPQPPIVISATHYQNHEELLQQKYLIQGEMEVALESNKNLIFVYKINFMNHLINKISFGLEVAYLVHQNEELYQRGQQLYELLTKYNPSFCKLSVPTYKICEQFNDVILYQIDVAVVGITPWRIEKRYSDLFDLHSIFDAMFQHLPHFPGKTISKLKTNEQIEKRKTKLNTYLESISKRLEIVTSELFNQFFEINKYASKYIFEPPQLVTSQQYNQTIKNCVYIPEQDLLLIVAIQNESYKQMMALVQNNENEVVHPLGFLEAISLKDNKIEKKWQKCYEYQAQCLHYSDSTLLVGLEKGKIVVYQMDSEFNQPIHQAHYSTHKSRVNGVYYDKFQKQIYSISSDGYFIVTQRDYLKHKDQLLLKGELTTMKVTDDRCVAFVGTNKGLVYIIDFSQNKVQCIKKMECSMRNKIVDIDINNQQGFLFVISEIGFLQVFDISKPGKEQNTKHKIWILINESSKRISYNKLRNHLYIADSTGFVSVLSEQTGTPIFQFNAHNFDCAITLLNYIDNKDHLITYGKDQQLKIWQLPKNWINLSEVKYQAFQEIKNEQISKQKETKNDKVSLQFKDDDEDELHNWHR